MDLSDPDFGNVGVEIGPNREAEVQEFADEHGGLLLTCTFTASVPAFEVAVPARAGRHIFAMPADEHLAQRVHELNLFPQTATCALTGETGGTLVSFPTHL